MPSAVELPSCEKLTMTLRNVLSNVAESEGEAVRETGLAQAHREGFYICLDAVGRH